MQMKCPSIPVIPRVFQNKQVVSKFTVKTRGTYSTLAPLFSVLALQMCPSIMFKEIQIQSSWFLLFFFRSQELKIL